MQVSLRRLDTQRDLRFGDGRERASILIQVGRALVLMGEYTAATLYLQEAESLGSQVMALDHQFTALRSEELCWFCLGRWDNGLELIEKYEVKQQPTVVCHLPASYH